MQIFVLSPDLVVLHALPGFWHPEDLARELRFAQVIGRLWTDERRTRAQKDDMFRRLQLHEIRSHPPATYARSDWQDFDVAAEAQRLRTEARDTFLTGPDGNPVLLPNGQPAPKPINVLVHERMAARPFVPFDRFDVEQFVDYGREFYDNNIGIDGRGKVFRKLEILNAKRAKEARREAQRAQSRRRATGR